MKRIIRLTESDLTRIVRRVINEQKELESILNPQIKLPSVSDGCESVWEKISNNGDIIRKKGFICEQKREDVLEYLVKEMSKKYPSNNIPEDMKDEMIGCLTKKFTVWCES